MSNKKVNSYLSIIELKDLLRISNIKRYRDNAQSRHRMIMSLYPQDIDANPRANFNILYRCERTNNRSFVLIRSSIPPANLPSVKTIKEIKIAEENDYVSFRITVNPVKRVKSKERFLSEYSEIESWFIEKVSEVFSEVEMVGTKQETIKRSLGGNDFINLVQIDGVAKVKDSSKLDDLLIKGLGRNKNYGAGLLTVKTI